MRKIIYLLFALIVLSACKDPDIGPDDKQNPVDDAGYIRFDSPAVGQKSSFVHFVANGYWEKTPSPINYTRDTIHWEITKQVSKYTFEITERLAGDYFGEDAGNRPPCIIRLNIATDGVILTTNKITSSPLLGYRDTVELALNTDKQYPFTDWRIGDNSDTSPYFGYVSNYNAKNNNYGRLDVYSDFTPTHYDGAGLLFAYNTEYGMVRHYGMNPWLGDISGFDLIRDFRKPNDKLLDLGGTKWQLKNVIYKNGSVKSIKEINPDVTYHIAFEEDKTITGVSGCNDYGGTFAAEGNKISINATSIALVVCPGLADDFDKIMSSTTTFDATESTLILNSDYKEYSGLEYERVYEREEFLIENSEWVLSKVHYSYGDIVPIGKLLGGDGSNTDFGYFELKFLDNNQLDGFSGCNTFSGTYKTDTNRIVIKASNTTKVSCNFSNEYAEILNNSTSYTIDKTRLVIYATSGEYKALEFSRKLR